MKAIFNREFKSYFTSMIGPVFVAALVLVTGIYFMVYNMSYGYPYFAYTLSASAIVFVTDCSAFDNEKLFRGASFKDRSASFDITGICDTDCFRKVLFNGSSCCDSMCDLLPVSIDH